MFVAFTMSSCFEHLVKFLNACFSVISIIPTVPDTQDLYSGL